MFGRTKKDVVVNLNLQKDLWSVKVDEGQIKQVMLNLYVNAWQAMPDGGRIYIKSENIWVGHSFFKKIGLKEPGQYVKISVVDTGAGMDNEVAEKIFDPFFTTKEMEGGTGLGLATAYGIIKGHKGVIRVASRVGEGSSFSLYLPALASESEKNKKGPFREKIVNGNGTVLLVDDEQSVIDVCSEMLVSLGYEVISVQKGKDALDILKQDGINIDLVILDMIMPEMSGLKVFKQIKSISPGMKVLLASGYSQKNDVEKLIRQSSDGFIQKPFDVARLSKRVMSCLESDISQK